MTEGFDEYDDGEHEEIKMCNNSCSHYDEINCCCWVASEHGLCRDVSEGDYCLYGFKVYVFKEEA